LPSTSLRTEGAVDGAADLLSTYIAVRAQSVKLAAPLSPEDQSAQSMPDASPAKWHLAHTTWFFETFILAALADYKPFDERFGYLFNSYYEALGPRQPRPNRGLMTRPSADSVMAYRRHVDRAMERFLGSGTPDEAVRKLVVLGFAHEEQHQELLLTDILHLFGQNPLKPAYNHALSLADAGGVVEDGPGFVAFEGGIVNIGRVVEGEDDFAFDNEGPRHQVLLRPYRLADRLTTNGEWLEFMADGGYRRAELWLSDGWAMAQAENWQAPLYWQETPEGGWTSLTLAGVHPIERAAPVTHISFYEADAYARWRGLRLPTEAEWEHAAQGLPIAGNFSGSEHLHPMRASKGSDDHERKGGLRQMFGDCWEWTASPYTPYPGFNPAPGAVGEYNGKFMINQMVLRGGSCVTPKGHVRATYRNFFHPHQRWQFSGLRLASDGDALAAVDGEFRRDVLLGLTASPKTLPSKYLYDKTGSALFEAICDLPEYYPTRTETALLQTIASDLAGAIPPGAVMIEYGSGASIKTRLLLSASPHLWAYAPMDISPDALNEAAASIRRDYPALKVEPITGDFTRPLNLPAAFCERPKVGFFPGSTIGNFAPGDAKAFLETARALLGPRARFIVGVDVVKGPDVLSAAYDDAAGVTAAFNLNLLTRINRELGGNFDLDGFRHQARWNAQESRMEMHLLSTRSQTATIGGRRISFAEGETIHTENSYKYRPEVFAALAADAGWSVETQWLAPEPSFAIFVLKA
jgi:dimethylhistidine N-methyltransferase